MKDRKSKRKRKVRGRKTITRKVNISKPNGTHQHHRYRDDEYEKAFSEWDETVRKAECGAIDEEQRAAVATKAAMLEALQVFTKALTKNLDRFNTNLGLVLSTRSSIAGSFVVYGTGDNGTNEFVPVVLTIGTGEVQNVEDHINFLSTGEWQKMADKPREEDQPYSILRKKPMIVRTPSSAGIV